MRERERGRICDSYWGRQAKKENRGRNELIDDERGSVVYLRERGGKRCQGDAKPHSLFSSPPGS